MMTNNIVDFDTGVIIVHRVVSYSSNKGKIMEMRYLLE